MMANTNRPNGFSPVKSLIGGGFVGQGNLYAVASDGSNTYAIGDVVMSAASSDANGVPFVTKWGGATTTSALPLGIITGFATPPVGTSLQGTSLTLEKQWLPLNDGTQYIYVADDPYLIFEAQFDSTAIAVADLHKNAAVTVTANQTSTLSTAAPLSNTVLTAPAVTATLPVRLLGAVQVQGNEIGAYVRVLCKWNYHEFGVTSGASGSVVSYLAP
jgi:hypothetical protein